MLKKKKFPSLYHQNNGILKALVTRASLNKALNSKSSTKKRIQHTPFYTADNNKTRGGGGRAEGREVNYWDISNNRP